jgi:hypothetical protein
MQYLRSGQLMGFRQHSCVLKIAKGRHRHREHIVVAVTVSYSTVVPMTYVVVLMETDFGAVSQVKHVRIVAALLVLR